MNLEDFLAPVGDSLFKNLAEANAQKVGLKLQVHRELEGLPDWEHCKLALLGVMEDRPQKNAGAAQAPDEIRKYLYELYWGDWQFEIADLGNIYAGETLADSMAAVKEVCFQLIKKGVIPVIMGGSQHITYGNYRAYDQLEQTVNLVSVDSRFDLGAQNEALNSGSYLSQVILQKPYILFNFSNIGYQTYFVNQEEIDLMERMFFEVHRLGTMRANIAEAEPVLRDADIVSMDLSAVRQSDAPGNRQHSPNGFTGEEACALARYAGLSDKVSSFGIYDCNPLLDAEGRTAHLVAQMLWYFMEGVQLRKGDYPFADKKDYQKFTVLINEGEYTLIFYKSPLSERWWIEVPLQEQQAASHQRHKLIPCSYADYEEALNNEIPERWWQAMKKSV